MPDANQNPAGKGGAGEVAGGDFKSTLAQTPLARQAARVFWLRLIDQAEERARNAAPEQRPKHRKLYKYLAARLARAVLDESDQHADWCASRDGNLCDCGRPYRPGGIPHGGDDD